MKQKYIDFIKKAEQSDEYWAQMSIADFTEELCRLMDAKDISRAKLAELIGTTQPYITKVLRGNVNFTLGTMTKLARALGAVVRVHLAPQHTIVKWHDVPLSTNVRTDFVVYEGGQSGAHAKLVQNSSTAPVTFLHESRRAHG